MESGKVEKPSFAEVSLVELAPIDFGPVNGTLQ